MLPHFIVFCWTNASAGLRDYTVDRPCHFFSVNLNVFRGIHQLFHAAVQAELKLRSLRGSG